MSIVVFTWSNVEKRVLRREFGPIGEEVTGGWIHCTVSNFII
jgi:hypothetical protein